MSMTIHSPPAHNNLHPNDENDTELLINPDSNMMTMAITRPRVNSLDGTTPREGRDGRSNSWSSSSDELGEQTGNKKPRLISEELFEDHRQLTLRTQEPDADSKSALLLLEFQKLRQANVLTDVSISIQNNNTSTCRAHASFLLAVCPTLGQKFTRRNEETNEFNLVLTCPQLDSNSGVVSKLLDYLYTNESIRVKSEFELCQLKLAATELEIPLPESLHVNEHPHFDCRSTLVGHLSYVCALLVTDSGLLVSGSRDNSLRVWDLETNLCKVELSDIHSDRVWALLKSKNTLNQERILSGSWDSTISVIDPVTWKVEKKLSGHTDWVTCLCSVGVDYYFASGSADGTVRVWRDNQPERVLRGHRGHVYAICASNDALFSAGNDGYICVWEKTHWRKVSRLNAHPLCNIRAMVWCNHLNALLSGASDGKIRIWTKNSVGAATNLQQTSPTLTGFSSSTTVVAAAAPTGSNSTAALYSLAHEVNAHGDWVEALVEMNSCRIASGSRDCTVKIWKATTTTNWELLQSIRQHSHWVYALVFTSNKNSLVSASCDMKIKVWNEESNS